MNDNGMLPDNTYCVLPGSEFEIKIRDGENPIYIQQYNIPEVVKPKEVERIAKWIKKRWVVEHDGEPNPWNIPLLAVPKKSIERIDPIDIRLYLDFRWVNAITKPPVYMVPLNGNMVTRLRGAKYFSELDLTAAYHQLLMEKSSRVWASFTSPNGKQYIWLRMLFGAKAVVTHFQRVAEQAVRSCSDFVVVYVDNILIFSNTL